MDTIIFQNFGAEILQRGEQYFIRYDAGEVVVQMKELPINESDVRRAQLSAKDAYEVILSAEQSNRAR